VHDERPAPARLELAAQEGVGESGRPPPPRQALRIADRRKDLLHGGRDFAGSGEGSHWDPFYSISISTNTPAGK